MLSDVAGCRISAFVKPPSLPFYRLVLDITELVVCPPTAIGLTASRRLSGVCPIFGECDKIRTRVGLLDDLVGARKQRWWYSYAERLGGLEIDHKLEFGRLFHREIAGLRPPEYPVHVAGGASK